MARRQVAKGRAAANRRYVDAVRRQMDFIDGIAPPNPLRPYGYRHADVDEVLRTGDHGELARVLRGEVA